MLRSLKKNKWILLSILPCFVFAYEQEDLSFNGFASQGISPVL